LLLLLLFLLVETGGDTVVLTGTLVVGAKSVAGLEVELVVGAVVVVVVVAVVVVVVAAVAAATWRVAPIPTLPPPHRTPIRNVPGVVLAGMA
jgi:hypothetical protein